MNPRHAAALSQPGDANNHCCGFRNIPVISASVMAPKLRLVARVARRVELDHASREIRRLVKAGAEVRLHRLAEKQAEEFGLPLVEIRNMLARGRANRREPGPMFGDDKLIVCGQSTSQREERRIHLEYALSVVIEKPEKPGLVGVIEIRLLQEIGR